MALKHLYTAVCLSLAALACGRSAPPEADVAAEPDPLSVTRWTEVTELFAEFPPLVVGETSRFAIHLTRLDSFAPLTAGRVEVHLRGAGAGPEVFHVEGPSRPGIFGVDVTPAREGSRELAIVVRADGVEDEHRVGQVDVHAHAGAARTAAADASGEEAGISFLKEQQWSLDFRTAVVQAEPVRESLRVPAQIMARPTGAADVAAPVDGRLSGVLDAPLGSTVTRGQELARLLPPPAVPGDLPQLLRAQAEAQSALALAVVDRERAERLTLGGAAPAKRLEEARAAEAQAQARASAADASLAQYNAARTGEPADVDGLFVVRAPLSGVIASRIAATGANVTAGTILFRVVDASQVHVVGHIPEAETARARSVTEAEVEVPGREARIPAGRLAGVGRVLDTESRTLPITFAFDNRQVGLPVGQSVFLHLLMGSTAVRPVVPAGAIVDDAGRPIVFVQLSGESFERRAVTIGARSGDRIQVTEGVSPGDRVVTRGAYLVRLASLSTSVPAHGHVH